MTVSDLLQNEHLSVAAKLMAKPCALRKLLPTLSLQWSEFAYLFPALKCLCCLGLTINLILLLKSEISAVRVDLSSEDQIWAKFGKKLLDIPTDTNLGLM